MRALVGKALMFERVVIPDLFSRNEAMLVPDYGGTTAAPFARQIIQDTLQYMGIREHIGTQPQTEVIVPDVAGLSVREATAALEALGLIPVVNGSETQVLDQMPVAGAKMWTGSQVMLYVREGELPDAQTLVRVPDVMGFSIVEANRQLRARSLTLQIVGDGLAMRQVPAAGEFVQPGDTVRVTFAAP